MKWEKWIQHHPAASLSIEGLSKEFNLQKYDPGAIFNALCDHGRKKFTYVTFAFPLQQALFQGLLNCQNAAELVIGLVLFQNRNENKEFSVFLKGVHGGQVPVLTPIIRNPGMRIQKNVKNKNSLPSGRMLFNGGHWVAEIDGVLYDLCTGISGSNLILQFIAVQADRVSKTYSCTIAGKKHKFSPIGGSTGGGLSEYRVEPDL